MDRRPGPPWAGARKLRAAVGDQGAARAGRNRTLKLLEGAGIKLAGVLSSVFGVSGMLMLRALAEGSAAPAAMASHRRPE